MSTVVNFLVLLLMIKLQLSRCLDNGVGLLPQMGYNAWFAFKCDITETLFQETAAMLVKLGLDKLGYKYINLDDCWAGGRYSNGTIYAKSPQFNSSLKSLADYVHSLGLNFGLYTDRGTKTCVGAPGMFGHEEIDANTYAKWGVDYIKVDSCSASTNQLVAFSEYAKIRDALNATNRPIFYSLCGWFEWYSPIGMSLANSWRIGGDGQQWTQILSNVDINAQYNLHLYSGPGGWNDPDFLVSNGPKTAINELQSRAQFSMWAIMASPLLISADIRNWNNETGYFQTYANKYVIDVNQDKAGIQGVRVQGQNLLLPNGKSNRVNCTNVWARELIDGSRAFVFLNNCKDVQTIICNEQCFNNAGFYYGVTVKIYDLWNDSKFMGNISTNITFYANNITANGGVKMYKMVPFFDQYPKHDLTRNSP